MTRTGLSPRLGEHSPEPVIEIHPQDASRHGLINGGFGRVSSAHGTLTARIKITGDQSRGSIFVPIHWNHQTSSATRVSDLVAPFCDPFSGQPEAKGTPCTVEPVYFPTTGFVVSRDGVALSGASYSARSKVRDAWFTTFASELLAQQLAAQIIAKVPNCFTVGEYCDAEQGIARLIAFSPDRIELAFFAAPSEAELPSKDAILASFMSTNPSQLERMTLLSGGQGKRTASDKTVCACFVVKRSVIEAAIKAGGDNLASIGKSTKAGTNCGSCRSEIKALFQELSEEAYV
jgi:assimilatory nitrate reductase catalytic subunit